MAETNQISVFLPNTPGELLKLCDHLKGEKVNILAISIQNAKDYVEELFKARERSGRRIVLAENYRGVLRESSDYSVIDWWSITLKKLKRSFEMPSMPSTLSRLSAFA